MSVCCACCSDLSAGPTVAAAGPPPPPPTPAVLASVGGDASAAARQIDPAATTATVEGPAPAVEGLAVEPVLPYKVCTCGRCSIPTRSICTHGCFNYSFSLCDITMRADSGIWNLLRSDGNSPISRRLGTAKLVVGIRKIMERDPNLYVIASHL